LFLLPAHHPFVASAALVDLEFPMSHEFEAAISQAKPGRDADYVFHELTRSICPHCRRVIDAKILLRDNKVYMSKRCPACGPYTALVYGDAKAYLSMAQHNKPGTRPQFFAAPIVEGCPHDCGLCPDHEQHACLGIIEVNSACDMDCPLCFADAGPGFNLTIEEVESILDDYVRRRTARSGAVLGRRAHAASAHHRFRARRAGAKHPLRDAQHQWQAHRARRPFPRRTQRDAAVLLFPVRRL
jgi:hypothetical protein